jgi:eukaryotic-like serine/threonine-protein kinase
VGRRPPMGLLRRGPSRRVLPLLALVAVAWAPVLGQASPPQSPIPPPTAVATAPPAPAPTTDERQRGAPVPAPPAVLWAFHPGMFLATPPVVAGDTVYVGDDDGFVYAVGTATGQARWGALTGDRVLATPTVAGDTVYVASGDLTTLDAASGRTLLQITSGRRRLTGITVANGFVLTAGLRKTEGFVDALSVTTAVQRWRVELAGAVMGAPTVVDGTVYVGSVAGELLALDVETGDRHWSATAPGPVFAPPNVAGGILYVAAWVSEAAADPDGGGALLAFDAATGRERWRTPIATPTPVSPLVEDGVVYALGHDAVYALDAADGAARWRFRAPDEVRGRPVVAGDLLLAGCRTGDLFALDLASGAERWRLATGSEVVGTALGADRIAYVAGRRALVAVALPAPLLSPVGALRAPS